MWLSLNLFYFHNSLLNTCNPRSVSLIVDVDTHVKLENPILYMLYHTPPYS